MPDDEDTLAKKTVVAMTREMQMTIPDAVFRSAFGIPEGVGIDVLYVGPNERTAKPRGLSIRWAQRTVETLG